MEGEMKTLFVCVAAALALGTAHAESVENSAEATSQAIKASAGAVFAGSKVVAGSVAVTSAAAGSVPLVAGTALQGSGQAMAEGGQSLWDWANDQESENGELAVDEETVIAQPVPDVPYEAQ
jgi:hypothetical protein